MPPTFYEKFNLDFRTVPSLRLQRNLTLPISHCTGCCTEKPCVARGPVKPEGACRCRTQRKPRMQSAKLRTCYPVGLKQWATVGRSPSPSGCQLQECRWKALHVAEACDHRHRKNLEIQATPTGHIGQLNTVARGSGHTMEIYVYRRHAKICRCHQVSLVRAHTCNQHRVGDGKNCTVVAHCKVCHLTKPVQMPISKYSQTNCPAKPLNRG